MSVQQKGDVLTWPLSKVRPVHLFPQLQKVCSQPLRLTNICWWIAMVFLYGLLLRVQSPPAIDGYVTWDDTWL